MNIIHILYYTVLRYFRDKKGLAQMLLFPIVLILILGSALSSAFQDNDLGITYVAYLNLDEGIASESFMEFLQMEEISALVEVKEVKTYEEGIDLIKDRRVSAFILIDRDYSERHEGGEKGNIQVISNSHENFRTIVVNSIVEAYASAANAIEATYRIGLFSPNYLREENIEQMPISSTGRRPTSMDYYSVTMLTMIMMYGASYGIQGIGEDYFNSIGGRIKASPVKTYEMYVGKTLGVVLTLFLQATILVLFTKFIFKVNWGSNILMVLFICFSLATLSTGLGAMICMLSSNKRKASTIVSVLVPVFTFISGGYTPIDNIGGIIQRLKFLSPNYLTHRAMFSQIFSSGETQLYLSIIWVVGLLTFITSAIAGRRQIQ